jgi:murein DD-endopeptidase MepM/ murein hydrolase activator NlpD
MPRPPSRGRVTSPYGWRIHPITGVRTHHNGEDTVGEGNFAPVSGTVIFAGSYYGLGNLVTIRENATTIWLVGHHKSLAVSRGDQVVEGVTFLGPIGMTGAATGVHAHTERRLSRMDSPQAGTATNPRDHYTSAAGGGGTPLPGEPGFDAARRQKEDGMYVKGSGSTIYKAFTDANGKLRLRTCATNEAAVAVFGGLVVTANDATLTGLGVEAGWPQGGPEPVLPLPKVETDLSGITVPFPTTITGTLS